ncbi:MAG: hypothetical protein ACYCPV_01695 [Thermoplasmata archaeon]
MPLEGSRPGGLRAHSATSDSEARAERRSRSIEEPMAVALLSREPYPSLEVRNPLHRTIYRVYFPEGSAQGLGLCTCPDFSRRDLGTCKHIEAAGRHLRMHPQGRPVGLGEVPDPAELWAALETDPERSAGLGTLHHWGRALHQWPFDSAGIGARRAPPDPRSEPGRP